MLETPRLILREWRDDDREPFAALNADPQVMAYFPKRLSRAESDAVVARIRRHFETYGYGAWAVEVKNGPSFIGLVGLLHADPALPFSPAVEIAWRLAAAAWGQGYASEAAERCLAYGFNDLRVQEIVAFTVPANQRSRRVMERIGMRRDPSGDFDHPALAPGHPLRRHVLYRKRRVDGPSAATVRGP